MDQGLDVEALHAALDAQRQALGLSWREVARQTGISPSTLSRMAQGRRPDVDSFAACVQWLGIPAERFFRPAEEKREADPVAVVSAYLRAGKELSPASANALEDIIRAAYVHLKEKSG
jgi:transcriptional regulator with XRE-family HTH domain